MAKDFHPRGIPLVRLAGLGGHQVTLNKCNYLDPELVKRRWKHFCLEQGDILISTSASFGRPAVVGPAAEGAVFYTGLIRFRSASDELDEGYLKTFLGSRTFMLQADAEASGSVISHFGPSHLRRMEIPLPPLKDQRAIAEVHAALDDKIELNRRINKTVEAMAQAIFRDWFVDFGPVRRKLEGATDPVTIMGGLMSDPARAAEMAEFFPDALGDDERPLGWSERSVGDLLEPRKGRNITKKTIVAGNVPVVAGGLNPAYYHNTPNVRGPVVTISASGANAGFVRLYHQDIWASDCSYISREQTDYIFTIYALLSSRQDEIYFMQQGAAQPHIYASDIKRLLITDAPARVWEAAENLLGPLFELVASRERENRALAETRDYLLPRLMSGEIRVSDVQSEAAA